jgi:hypothetical protein
MIYLLILIAFIIYMTGYGQGGDVIWLYLSLPVLYKPRADETPLGTLVSYSSSASLIVPQVSNIYSCLLLLECQSHRPSVNRL